VTDVLQENVLPETVTISMDEIVPYPNNPRRITEEAIEAVRQSIEKFGYVQPIALHKETKQIVVGHTRFQALQRLGVKEIEVYLLDISLEKAKEYRVIDNRLNELSEWDHRSLVLELREWDTQLLESYFPNIDLEIGQLKNMEVTQNQVDQAVTQATSVREASIDPLTKVVCPDCDHTFKVKAASLPGISFSDLDKLRAQVREE
jgi:hypothetical protein